MSNTKNLRHSATLTAWLLAIGTLTSACAPMAPSIAKNESAPVVFGAFTAVAKVLDRPSYQQAVEDPSVAGRTLALSADQVDELNQSGQTEVRASELIDSSSQKPNSELLLAVDTLPNTAAGLEATLTPKSGDSSTYTLHLDQNSHPAIVGASVVVSATQ